jgi:hypothetical protein
LQRIPRKTAAIIVVAVIVISSLAVYGLLSNGSPGPTEAQRLALNSADLGAGWTVDTDTSLGTNTTAVPPMSSLAPYDINNGTLSLYMIIGVYDSKSDCIASFEKINSSTAMEPEFHYSTVAIGDRGFLSWHNGQNFSDKYPEIIFMKGNTECIISFWPLLYGPTSGHHDWDLSAILMIADLQAAKIADLTR